MALLLIALFTWIYGLSAFVSRTPGVIKYFRFQNTVITQPSCVAFLEYCYLSQLIFSDTLKWRPLPCKTCASCSFVQKGSNNVNSNCKMNKEAKRHRHILSGTTCFSWTPSLQLIVGQPLKVCNRKAYLLELRSMQNCFCIVGATSDIYHNGAKRYVGTPYKSVV